MVSRWSAPLVVAAALGAGCASGPPPRYVLERDLDGYAYRRYQKVLDVEFPVAGNPAVGHTATYVRRGGDGPNGSGREGAPREQRALETASAFVTVYERADSLAAEVRDRVRALGTYEARVRKVEGEWVWMLDGGADRWLLWVSGNRVVKLGASGDAGVPEVVAEDYLDLYPSDLDERGRAHSGATSAGPSLREREEQEEDEELPMPRHLRQGRGE